MAKPARRPLPEHLPREVRKYPPKQTACPDCGGELKHLGEDVLEILEYVPARLKVIRQIRPKLAALVVNASCKRRRRAVRSSAALPSRGLLAHVLVSKYCDHLPLYRQSEIYAREAWSWSARRWRTE
jgi:transposase